MRSKIFLGVVFILILNGQFFSGSIFGLSPAISPFVAQAAENHTVVIRPHDTAEPADGNQVARDVTLNAGWKDTNQGRQALIQIGKLWHDDPKLADHAIQEFDIKHLPSGEVLPSNAIIDEAEFQVYFPGDILDMLSSGGQIKLTLERLALPDGENWDEQNATWNEYRAGKKWQHPGGDGDASTRRKLTYTYFKFGWGESSLNRPHFDVTSLAQDAIEKRDGKLQLLLTDVSRLQCGIYVFGCSGAGHPFWYLSGDREIPERHIDDDPAKELLTKGSPDAWPTLTIKYHVPQPQEVSGHVKLNGGKDLPATAGKAAVRLEYKNNEGDWVPAQDEQGKDLVTETLDDWSFEYVVGPNSAAYDYRVVVDPPAGYQSGPHEAVPGPKCRNTSNRTDNKLAWVGDKHRLPDDSACKNNYFYVSKSGGGSSTTIQGYKYNDNGQGTHDSNGTKDSDEMGLGGWRIQLYEAGNPGQPIDTIVTSSKTDTVGFYQFTNLDKKKRYRIEEVARENWQQTSAVDTFATPEERPTRDIGNHRLTLPPGSVGDITDLQKEVATPVLAANQSETNVTLRFVVRERSVASAVIHEKLAANLKVVSPKAYFNGVPVDIKVQDKGAGFDFALDQPLPEGMYFLTFTVNYFGPADTDQPVDFKAVTNDCFGSARIEFKSQEQAAQPQCRAFPEGAIRKQSNTARLTITADAWLGNKSVTLGDKLKIGRDTLVISGGDVNKQSGSASFLDFPRYQIPTTGKVVWEKIQQLMDDRVATATKKKTTESWSDCSPKDNGAVLALGGKVWDLHGCDLTLGSVRLQGTGTFIHPGIITLKGPIQSTDDATLGIVSNKPVVICAQRAQGGVENVAIFTSSEIQFHDSSAPCN